MEVSHMSPAPTSPPDGDDPCWTDASDMAIDTITLLICLCGLVGNGAVIWLRCFHSFLMHRNPITVYILHLVNTDFTFLLFMVISSLFYVVENASCSAVVSPKFLGLFFQLPQFIYNTGLYLLTAISIESCGSFLCPHWYQFHRPKRLSAVMCDLLWALSTVLMTTVASLCLSGEQEPCRVSLISLYTLNLFIFVPLMVISNMIFFINIKTRSQEFRRLHLIFLLTVLSFLIFGLPLSLQNFLQQFSYTIMSTQVVFLLTCIHSSIKPFIYFSVGSCWGHCSLVSLRVAFQRIFEEEYIASRNDVPMEMVVPPTALLNDPGGGK